MRSSGSLVRFPVMTTTLMFDAATALNSSESLSGLQSKSAVGETLPPGAAISARIRPIGLKRAAQAYLRPVSGYSAGGGSGARRLGACGLGAASASVVRDALAAALCGPASRERRGPARRPRAAPSPASRGRP